MKSKNILPFAALCLVPFIMVLGNSMLIPVLPKIKSVLHLTQLQTGLLITAFSIPAGVAIIFVGILSDRVGRKKVIAPSLIVYGIGGLIAMAAAIMIKKPYTAILAGRIVQGIGAAGTAPVAMAMAGDVFQSKERSKALGYLEASNGMGKVLSPVLGAGAGLLTWWAPFAVYGVLSIPAALFVWFFCIEPKKKPQPPPMKKYFTDLAKTFKEKTWSLISCYFAGTIVLLILFGVLFYFSDLLEEKFKIEGIVKGLLIAAPVFVMSVTSLTTGMFMQKRRKLLKTAVWVGLAIMTGALAALAFLDGPVWLAVFTVLIGLGSGFVLPSLNTLVTSSASGPTRGLVTSVYGAVRFFGVAIGPPAFGRLMDHGKFAVFVPAAALTAAGALLALFLLKMQELIPEKGAQGQQGQGKAQGQGKSPRGSDQTSKGSGGGGKVQVKTKDQKRKK